MKQNTLVRMLSYVLALVMITSMCSIGVFAMESDEASTRASSSPAEVSSSKSGIYGSYSYKATISGSQSHCGAALDYGSNVIMSISMSVGKTYDGGLTVGATETCSGSGLGSCYTLWDYTGAGLAMRATGTYTIKATKVSSLTVSGWYIQA